MADTVVIKPIPELTETEPAARLIEFYVKLGWNREDRLDPTKVRMCEHDLTALLAAETEHAKQVLAGTSGPNPAMLVGFLWVNKGPSGSGKTPGMVELYPGWVSSTDGSQEGVA